MKIKLTLIIIVVTMGIYALSPKPKRMEPEAVDAIIEKHMEKITPTIEKMIESKNTKN